MKTKHILYFLLITLNISIEIQAQHLLLWRTVIEKKEGTVASYFMDSYPADVLVSLEKLSVNYNGNCLKVRRNSDDAMQVIGFINNYLDTTALKSFAGLDSVFINIWYDQSGNGYNAVQGVNYRQPNIYNGSTLIYKNNKTAIKFDGVDDIMQTAVGVIGGVTQLSAFVVCAYNETAQTNNIVLGASNGGYSGTPNQWFQIKQSTGTYSFTVYSTGTIITVSNLSLLNLNQRFMYCEWDGGLPKITVSIDDSTKTSTSAMASSLNLSQELDIGAYDHNGTPTGFGNIYLQEIIIYKTVQSANVSAIRDYRNSFYSTY